MLRPRWRKVLRDLWSNKSRTALVVLSIAVGVFAIGMVLGSRVILLRDLSATWMSVNPASATLSTEAFDDDLDRKSTRLNSSHANISYAVFCLKKKTILDH